jgi:hypothetical protein
MDNARLEVYAGSQWLKAFAPLFNSAMVERAWSIKMLNALRTKLHWTLAGSVAIVGIAACMATPRTAQAQDRKSRENADRAADVATSTEDVHRWIKELDSDVFANREGSVQRLYEAGRAAIEPLSEAARGQSLEQTTAAIGVLRRLSKAGDCDTSKAAQAALEQIARGQCDSAASLAADALLPPVDLPPLVYSRPVRPCMCNLNFQRIRFIPAQPVAIPAALIPVAAPLQPAATAPGVPAQALPAQAVPAQAVPRKPIDATR